MEAAEEDLVRRARMGDRLAFEELVRRTTRLVYARVYLETGNRDRAEDLVQETYLIAFRSLSQLADPTLFRTWLMTIAQNVVIDSARHDQRKKRSSPPRSDASVLEGVANNDPTPSDELARRETRQRVLSLLRSMPEEYRLPLMMRYLAGADYGTISLQLGLSSSSLRGLLHRGLELLRGEVKRAIGADSILGG
jgi:RNA polymerase sigma-70 factor (ECF subfamily)